MTIAFKDLKLHHFEEAWPLFENKTFIRKFEVGGIHLLQHDGKAWNIIATVSLGQTF